MKIYRDDDINYLTSVDELKRIHEPFVRHNKIHTVACEMYRLWENKSLFWFLLTDPLIDVELHGWQHDPHHEMLPQDVFTYFSQAINYWTTHAKRMLAGDLPELKRITTYCATWNKSSSNVEDVCKLLGLKINTNAPGECAWMFHYWSTNPKQVEEMITSR